ncbi:hypothetical protein AVEN_200206-1 [Araneus ventricosus]|uniref:Uncharacterized protein n=1 Tax=Araneus ventricosus TaxID=182803 RepID=A0A4Y2P9P1_ARAVE|nr:hypothetical protein AVEN_200206-1 [Araneus ventricosus]
MKEGQVRASTTSSQKLVFIQLNEDIIFTDHGPFSAYLRRCGVAHDFCSCGGIGISFHYAADCECMLMIPEDQQSYIRSMSWYTLKKSKVNRGFKQDPFWKAPGRES